MEVQIQSDKMNYWWVGGWIYIIHDDIGEDLIELGYSKGKATEEEVKDLFGEQRSFLKRG